VPSNAKKHVYPRGQDHSDAGISLREHFASMAMQGMLANAGRKSIPFDRLARDAVSMADALLADLKSPSPPKSSPTTPS
jgi:hypothetical protein